MRIQLSGFLAALAVSTLACKGGSSSSGGKAASAQAFLPASPDLAVRVDLDRARTWAPFATKVAPVLLREVQPVLDEMKAACGLDPIAEAKSVFLTRTGANDLALVVGGLPKDRVQKCAGPDRALRLDGDLLSVHRNARAIASGKFVQSGELVILARGGAALDAAAWKAEEAKAKTAPGWTTSLDPSSVAAAWIVTPKRKFLARTDLGSPLVVKAGITSESLQTAKIDQQLVYATGEYFAKANAGTIATAINGSTVEAILTVQPAQLETMLTLVTSMVAGDAPVDMPTAAGQRAPDTMAPDTAPQGSAGPAEPDLPLDPKIAVDCTSLKASIGKYLDASVQASPAAGRAAMQKMALQLQPAFEDVFASRCVTDQWSTDAVRCHIAAAHGGKLRRFERCKLSTTQRANLDKDLQAAMSKVGLAPITKESVQGSGSGAAGSAAPAGSAAAGSAAPAGSAK